MTERQSGEVEPESGMAWDTKKDSRSGEVEPESEVAWETMEERRSGEMELGSLRSHRRSLCVT